MIKGIQVVGILVSFYLLAQTFLNYRRGNYDSKRAFFFFILWGLVASLFVFPSFALFVLPILTTQDMVMSVLVIGLIVVFILISELYEQVGKVEGRLTELVQNLAIRNYLNEATRKKNEDR